MESIKALAREVSSQRARFLVKKAVFSFLDLFSGRGRSAGEIEPPRGLNFAGGGSFQETGEEFFGYFCKYGRIQSDFAILDVGCAVGRMALPLTKFISTSGRYEGFDIVPEGIEWCRTTISSRYSNFTFRLVDVFNGNYNPKGTLAADKFRFPYSDAEFDFVFLTSVFTHLLPKDLSHYLDEVARVLKPARRALFTFFLLNDEALQRIRSGGSTIDFCYDGDGYKTRCRNHPEDAVAYDQGWILEQLTSRGLRLAEPILSGSWSGRADGVSYQDMVVVERI
mgnify:CR=1 FL=1